MTWETFDSHDWKRGQRVKLVDGKLGTVLRRCEGAYRDSLHVRVDGEDKPALLYFRDIAEVFQTSEGVCSECVHGGMYRYAENGCPILYGNPECPLATGKVRP